MSADDTAIRLLDRALTAMNQAVAMTSEHGPAVAIEFIADFLNDGDAVDEEMADTIADDWLTRWQVTPASAPTSELNGGTDPGDPRCHSANPDEFAARWNSRTEDERIQHLRWIQEDADVAQRCRLAHTPQSGDRP